MFNWITAWKLRIKEHSILFYSDQWILENILDDVYNLKKFQIPALSMTQAADRLIEWLKTHGKGVI